MNRWFKFGGWLYIVGGILISILGLVSTMFSSTPAQGPASHEIGYLLLGLISGGLLFCRGLLYVRTTRTNFDRRVLSLPVWIATSVTLGTVITLILTSVGYNRIQFLSFATLPASERFVAIAYDIIIFLGLPALFILLEVVVWRACRYQIVTSSVLSTSHLVTQTTATARTRVPRVRLLLASMVIIFTFSQLLLGHNISYRMLGYQKKIHPSSRDSAEKLSQRVLENSAPKPPNLVSEQIIIKPKESLVQVAMSKKYSLHIPSAWRTEEQPSVYAGTPARNIYIYDEQGRLVMKIGQPLREIGYEGMHTVGKSTILETDFGSLEKVIRISSENMTGEQPPATASGFAHYSWMGGGDLWKDSFEVFVFFGTHPY